RGSHDSVTTPPLSSIRGCADPAGAVRSSTIPSQSSSAPLQVSGTGAACVHESKPQEQNPDAAQAPRPEVVANECRFPSQSLSTPSQTSGFPGKREWFVSSQSVAAPPGQLASPGDPNPSPSASRH